VDLGYAVEDSSADTIIQVLLQASDIMGKPSVTYVWKQAEQ